MRINNFSKLVIPIIISELAGVVGAFFTTPAVQSNWYLALKKPALNPPGVDVRTGLDDIVCAYGGECLVGVVLLR